MKIMKLARNACISVSLLLVAVTATAHAQQPGDRLSDEMIEKLVEHRLMRAGILKGASIKVNVDGGVVELDGKVLTKAAKRRAARIAWKVDDVLRVKNDLEVESGFRNDQAIADEITKDIRSHIWFDIFDWVRVRVNNGVVTLTGDVREPWRKEEYGNIAEDVLGVKEVNNQIEALPASIYDDRLRLATAMLIYTDSRFARYANRINPPIHIIVENGRITLEGAVNSQVEKRLIGSLVRSGILAFDVQNNLKVDTESEAG